MSALSCYAHRTWKSTRIAGPAIRRALVLLVSQRLQPFDEYRHPLIGAKLSRNLQRWFSGTECPLCGGHFKLR
jgi:hypothetical protein